MNKSIEAPRAAHSSTLTERLRAHIQLADPITWISPVIMVMCGAIATGRNKPGFAFTNPHDLFLVFMAVLMCGPFATGFSQSINDYFDRDLDAINDPARPIPSGRISLTAARLNWMGLGLAALIVALFLTQYSIWLPILGGVGLFIAAAYSVPPIKLKQNFWLGPPSVGLGYVCISWLSGHLIFAPMTAPSLILALICSAMAVGLLFLNDIKSVEGDRKLGMKSMTVALGVEHTLLIAYFIIGGCELILLVLALMGGYLWAAAFIVVSILVPLYSQIRLYKDPTHTHFKQYLLASNPFVILMQIVSAFIVGGYLG